MVVVRKILHSEGVHRNHLQLLNEILFVCREPMIRIEVMREVDVSLRVFEFCLKYLMKQDLVRFHRRKKTYVTTEKGLRYLHLCTGIQKD